MQKLAAFYLSNTKKELHYYGNGKTAAELQKIIQDAEVFKDDDYEFLQEAEVDFEDEQSNYAEDDDLEIENLINLDAEEITSSLDKIIKEYEKINDIHYISDNNDSDTVNEEGENWYSETAADKYVDD